MTPKEYDRFLISEYLRHGSMDKVFKIHKYDLAISYAGYARLLEKYGVVKSAGPNTHLSESLFLLDELSTYKVSIEKIYHRFAPHTLQISSNTIHRILHHVRHQLVRRYGTALLISPQSQPSMFLVANDQSLSSPSLGLSGNLSLPMTHSKQNETGLTSITRVLQQEVYSQNVIDGNFPKHLVKPKSKPIMYINIADIKVSVYRLLIPDKYCSFSSFKLTNHRFLSGSEVLLQTNLRPGIGDIIYHYLYPSTKEITSTLNSYLLNPAKEMVK